MTLHFGLTIDPGMSNGACLFSFSDLEPFRIMYQFQFTGGAPGLAAWLDENGVRVVDGRIKMDSPVMLGDQVISALVVEKFTPHSSQGFALTQASAEPLRGEGVLIGRGFEPFIQWAEPAHQYFMGGESLLDRKRRSREFLKLYGFYVTGATVGQKDADDAISATLHAISWLRRKRHMPTLLALFKPREEK